MLITQIFKGLRKEIEELKSENKTLVEKCEHFKKQNTQLQNRCAVFTNGIFCERCNFECEKRKHEKIQSN